MLELVNHSRSRTILLASLLTFVFSGFAVAQWNENPATGSPQNRVEDRTNLSGMVGLRPELNAELIHPKQNAAKKQAVVRSDVWGVNLAPPKNESVPTADRAFLAYSIDDEPPIETDRKEYTFENLSPGRHTIHVQLMAARGQPIGDKVTLNVRIPK
jgi:hypothetical protein